MNMNQREQDDQKGHEAERGSLVDQHGFDNKMRASLTVRPACVSNSDKKNKAWPRRPGFISNASFTNGRLLEKS